MLVLVGKRGTELKPHVGRYKAAHKLETPHQKVNITKISISQRVAQSSVYSSMDTLPSTTLIPPSALLRRFLTRLPKQILVSLVLIWLDHPLCPVHSPSNDDDDYFMDDEESLEEKREIYAAQRDDVNITKKAVIDRILGQDWVCSL